MKNTWLEKNHFISITNYLYYYLLYKVVQMSTMCNLQSRLSELLERPLSKTLVPCSRRTSATTVNFWKSGNRIHGALSVCQARMKNFVTPFLRHLQKTIFKKQTKKQKDYTFPW